jgi:hypothetical protein
MADKEKDKSKATSFTPYFVNNFNICFTFLNDIDACFELVKKRK